MRINPLNPLEVSPPFDWAGAAPAPLLAGAMVGAGMFGRPQTLSTLAAEALDRALAQVPTEDVNKSMELFSTRTYDPDQVVRNSDCFATAAKYGGWDLTCCGWHAGNLYYGVTAIAADCVLYPNHVHFHDGDTFRFVDGDDNIHDRKMSSHTSIDGTDIHIGILSSPLPATITPASVLPENAGSDYLGEFDRIPTLRLNQFGQVGVGDLTGWGDELQYNEPVDGLRDSFWFEVVNHDSGYQCFMIVNNRPAFLSGWHYVDRGANVAANIDACNSAMGSLGSANTLTETDLSYYKKVA